MRKNKIIIIVIIVIALILAGIIGFLYMKTDFFKSNRTLFYQYLANSEIVEEDVKQICETAMQNISTNNYSATGTITCSMATINSTTNVSDIQKLFSTKYNLLNNRNLNQAYSDYTFSVNEQNVLILRTLRDGDTYAIKADNVVNKYLALENHNLKEFFSKLEVEDVSSIPDTIPQANMEELLKIDPDLWNTIKSNYLSILNKNLTEDKFRKTTNNNSTTIELSLTEQEVMKIGKELLENLKNDNDTINLIIQKASLLGYNMNIDSFKTTLQEKIDEINNTTYSEETGYLKLAVTGNDKKTVSLEISTMTDFNNNDGQEKVQETYKIDLSEKNKITITNYTAEGSINKVVVAFGYEFNKFEMTLDVLDVKDNQETTVARMQYQMLDYTTQSIKQTAAIEIMSEENNKVQINIDNTMNLKEDIQIEKITDQNAVILNKMSAKQLQKLRDAITMNLMTLYAEQTNNLM